MRSLTILSVVLAAGSAIPGRADTFTFDFNSLNSGATASQIATYMDNYFIAHGCSTCSVTVTGAVADKTYDGDGNVVGPNGQPLTLGTTNGATSNSSTTPSGVLGKTNNLISGTTDTFIANTNDSAQQISNEFYLTFSGIQIASVSFDYEIFPDGGPQQPPDFEFEAGDNKNGTDPLVSGFGTGGVQYGVKPSSSGSDGSSVKSPDSSSESSAQYIGTWSGSLNDVSELDFVDWPATIAIDNLSITTPVPEPGSAALLLTIAAGAWFGRRKFQKA
ncbi:MAG TPA: PEP-CTERM sorting domain-containing protein [Bryobacteraceae bacterium]|nr:PEP-CTERM sorting domain-containing protein [Bryobacteraceae bacterium]